MLLKAYAKVNLGLKILGKRADGYHNIQTILLPINFFDLIELTGRGERCDLESSTRPHIIKFSSNLPPYGKDNLCVKAAELFFSKTKFKSGVNIKLEKQIWIGAGLGGGSSCAAQVLIGMNKILGNPLTQEELLELALKIGSDVPFFIKGGPSFIEGKGEVITSLPTLPKPVWFVLVYPNFPISTEWAYSKVKNCLTREEWDFKVLKDFSMEGKVKELAKNLHNDFEPIIFQEYPELKKIKERLFELGAWGASLSGSGSCVYGIFEKGVGQGFSLAKFESIFPDYKVKIIDSRVV